MQRFRINVLETYAVRTLEQDHENIGFITIRWTANNCTYSTRQHFAVLAFLHAASNHSRFCIAVPNVYHQRLPYELHAHTTGCALSFAYLKACESVSRAITKYISRVILSTFRIQTLSSCSIYQKSYSYACTVAISIVCETSGTCKSGSGDSNLSSRRALQSVAAADALKIKIMDVGDAR